MPLLLRASGPGWSVEIVGKRPPLPPFIACIPNTTIEITGCVNAIEVHDPVRDCLEPVFSGQSILPFLFEAVGYDIYFERLDPSISINLPPGAELRHLRQSTAHYFVDFGQNVGFFDLSVESTAVTTNFRLEVFSRKIDYRSDYLAIRDDVSKILRNLAMAANAKTYGVAQPAWDRKPTLIEWFALVEQHFDEFVSLANAIAKHPHSNLTRSETSVSTDRARRVTKRTIDRALRGSSVGSAITMFPLPLPRQILQRTSRITFDTPENRYFKAVLHSTYQAMRALQRSNVSEDEDGDHDAERKFFDHIRPILKSMERRIEALIRSPFLADVGSGSLNRPTSMVFSKHPHYSRFDRMARLLNGGLSLASGYVPIGVKSTAVLYEYWCFLKLIELLRKDGFDLVQQTIVKVRRFRTAITLQKGKQAAVEFRHEPSGRSLIVVYNRLFDRLPTLNQKPDNVIQLASNDKFFVFDAKYRVQFDPEYMKQYGGAGPTCEDINTMHRYRDAIALPHPMKENEYRQGVVIGAAVLFPFPEEEDFTSHRFYKSLDSVEIGGLPFLPGATELVEKKLHSLLDKYWAL